jgi:hypothetical protein
MLSRLYRKVKTFRSDLLTYVSRHHQWLHGNEKPLNARLQHNFGLIQFNNDKYSFVGCSTKVFNVKNAGVPHRGCGDGEQQSALDKSASR